MTIVVTLTTRGLDNKPIEVFIDAVRNSDIENGILSFMDDDDGFLAEFAAGSWSHYVVIEE